MRDAKLVPEGLRSNLGAHECQEIADFAPAMIWRSGLDKLCDWFNKPWLDFVGRSIDQEVGYGWSEGMHPDDVDRCMGIYTTSFDAREPFRLEYRRRRHDGEYRWLLDNGVPFFREGEFGGYLGSRVDVTAHKRLEAGQQLLISELNHRVKNTLATVQSIAAQSFRGRPEAGSYNTFTRRLVALARAHDVVARSNWEGASLVDMLDQAVRPLVSGEHTLQASGPPVYLMPKVALVLSTMFHELAANAGTFGALSVPEGRVVVTWDIGSGDEPRLALRWEERGGPPVLPPARQGFGTRLARQLGRELAGDVRLELPAEGAVFTIDVPLSHVAV